MSPSVESQDRSDELPVLTPSPSRRSLRLRDRLPSLWLLLPAAVALLALFVVPLIRVVIQSVTEPETGLGNYIQLFTDGYTLDVLIRTLTVGVTVAVITAVLGYPYRQCR